MRGFVPALLGLAVPAAALAVVVAGNAYAPTATVDGRTLALLGAGLRERWFFDVYTLAAYSESGRCDAAAIVHADEAKYLRIDMLRTVPAEWMGGAIGASFEAHMPADASETLKQQRRRFEGYFRGDSTRGSVFEFSYVPGRGTALARDGAPLGPPLAGVAFHRVLWDIYFGEATCCAALKRQILDACGQ